MPEQNSITVAELVRDSDKAGFFLMDALSAKFKNSITDQPNLDPGKGEDRENFRFNVVLTVNGHQIPFRDTVEDIFDRMNAELDKRAMNMMKERFDTAMEELNTLKEEFIRTLQDKLKF